VETPVIVHVGAAHIHPAQFLVATLTRSAAGARRVIVATHGVAINTLQRIAHAQ
jgi:predicted ATPase